MTQHTLGDVVFDSQLFDPKHCVHEDCDDFRGLTCCQAGSWLQDAWKQNLPAINQLVEHVRDLPEGLPPRVRTAAETLREFLSTDFGRHVIPEMLDEKEIQE